MVGKAFKECRRPRHGRLHLAKRYVHGGARKAIIGNRQRGRPAAGRDGVDDLAFESKLLPGAVALEHGLKGVVIFTQKRPLLAGLIAKRMRRINVRAGYSAFRQRFCRRMSPAVRQQF